jgi:hypothetical protein
MMGDIKPRPGHAEYLRVLARMTPSQRAMKAFELSGFAKSSFRQGLRRRFPAASEAELHAIYLERLAACHNRNY